MNKKTQMWIGVAAVVGIGYWLWAKDKSKDKVFANASGRLASRRAGAAPPHCQVYEGSCNAPVGFIITQWIGGTAGIVVANSSERCIVCPVSSTPTGMPEKY